MSLKENISTGSQEVQLTPEEEEARAKQHEENADPNSHLRDGHLFSNEDRRRGKVLVVGENDPYDVAAERAKGRRVDTLHDAVMKALVDRVQDPTGAEIMRIGWREFEKLRDDKEFQSFATYAASMMFYSGLDGKPDMDKPRTKPVRPFLQNEVGMYRNHIVVLKDAGPDDVGDGKYHQVHEDTPIKGE